MVINSIARYRLYFNYPIKQKMSTICWFEVDPYYLYANVFIADTALFTILTNQPKQSLYIY